MSVLELYILLFFSYMRNVYKKRTILQNIRGEINAFIFKRIDYRLLIAVAKVFSVMFNRNYGLNDSFSQTHNNILGFPCTVSHHFCVIRQRILKKALLYDNKQLSKQLEICAAEIRHYLDKKNIQSPVIFAPLHTVSDIIQTVIAALVTKKPAVVVSLHDSMGMLEAKQDNNSQGISIEQFNPEVMEGNAGSGFHDVIFSLTENMKSLVIFPDAIPECTTKMAKKKMKTFSVKMFGKSCELHTGLPVFSRLLKQKVLFYSLSLDQGNNLKLKVLDCVEHNEVEKKMPELITDCIQNNSREWILWHYTSFFSYNY